MIIVVRSLRERESTHGVSRPHYGCAALGQCSFLDWPGNDRWRVCLVVDLDFKSFSSVDPFVEVDGSVWIDAELGVSVLLVQTEEVKPKCR